MEQVRLRSFLLYIVIIVFIDVVAVQHDFVDAVRALPFVDGVDQAAFSRHRAGIGGAVHVFAVHGVLVEDARFPDDLREGGQINLKRPRERGLTKTKNCKARFYFSQS